MKAIRATVLLSALLILSACGPLINIMEVDVRLPATRPLNKIGRASCRERVFRTV